MVISDSLRFLFVHVQKTGGSTIDRRLREVLPDARRIEGMDRHATLGKLLRAEPALESYWTIGFVRNPWARMLSWYRMAERFEAGAREGVGWAQAKLDKNQFLREVAQECPDFESFVMTGPERWDRLTVPQIRYLTTKRGRRADLIGRQETLEADLRGAFARLELPWEPLESVNLDRERPDYRDHYTEPMRRRVEEIFARDLATFGYRF